MSASIAYCERSASFPVGEDRHRAVVRDREPATCPATSAPTWTYHVVFGETTARDGARSAVSNRSQPLPRVGEEQDRELPLGHEEREVVGDQVHERDQHEQADEVADQRAWRVLRPPARWRMPSRRRALRPAPRRGGRRPAEERDQQLAEPRLVDDEGPLHPRREVLAMSSCGCTRRTAPTSIRGDERDRARSRLRAGQTRQRPAGADPPFHHVEGGDPSGRYRTASTPRSPPTCPSRTRPSRRARRTCTPRSRTRAHAGSPGPSRRARGRRRRAAPRPPASGRLRQVLGRRPGLVASDLPRPDECVGDRAPRGQCPPDVPEHDRERGTPSRRSRRSRSARGCGAGRGNHRRGQRPRRGRTATESACTTIRTGPKGPLAESHASSPRPCSRVASGDRHRTPSRTKRRPAPRRPPIEHPGRDEEVRGSPVPCATEPKLLQGRTSRTARTESDGAARARSAPAGRRSAGCARASRASAASRCRSRGGARPRRHPRRTTSTFSPFSSLGRLIPPRGRPRSTTITIVVGFRFAGVVSAGVVTVGTVSAGVVSVVVSAAVSAAVASGEAVSPSPPQPASASALAATAIRKIVLIVLLG